ncbi:MAG TPA: 2-C-methyl-D-erythritol 2,4-cyclodiphosphate synthase [Candidatus Acetothermia bacterium]|nr:2-C-methyl-D-erythritol 2,4-cyclodiphosphate synthase [Candidatus Acetothermia bacterium]
MTGCRTGLGIDFHRFAAGRPLVIGGVTIDHPRGLLGHSDADVLTHAICDALLGAAGLGDIGTHFPDTDERYRGISSLALLGEVISFLSRDHWHPINVDATLIAQEPKLIPYFQAMKEALGEILHLPPQSIGLKATTSEGMGAIGRAEGISAFCVALIERVTQ